MSKISVIVPCYNVEKWIDRCLQSLINQTIAKDKLEIICLNDCSTDRTSEKLGTWKKKYPSLIRVFTGIENRGLGAMRNWGIEESTGDWIFFIDSDDWLEKECLEILFTKAVSENYDLVSCRFMKDRSEELTYGNMPTRTEKDKAYRISGAGLRKVFLINPPLHNTAWGKLINKSFLLKNSLYFPEGLYNEDVYWTTTTNLYLTKVAVVEEFFYHYFTNNSGSMTKERNPKWYTDAYTVYKMFLKRAKEEGFYSIYKNEIDYIFFINGYVQSISTMMQINPQLFNKNYFNDFRKKILNDIPDIRNNTYIRDIPKKSSKIFLHYLEEDFQTQKEYNDFVHLIKTGIIFTL